MSENPDNDFMNRLEGDTRALVMALLQAVERYSREIERQRDIARRGSQDEAARATAMLEAEKQAVGAANHLVRNDTWWETATPDRAATAYARAVAFSREDPVAAEAADRIREEMHTRWGIDPADALRQAHDWESRARGEDAEAVKLGNEADLAAHREQEARERQAAERDRDADGSSITDKEIAALKWETDEVKATMAGAWDSPERRQRIADQMRRDGLSEEAINSRITADTGVGQPPLAAVTKPTRTSKRATRRTPNLGRGQERARGGQ